MGRWNLRLTLAPAPQKGERSAIQPAAGTSAQPWAKVHRIVVHACVPAASSEGAVLTAPARRAAPARGGAWQTRASPPSACNHVAACSAATTMRASSPSWLLADQINSPPWPVAGCQHGAPCGMPRVVAAGCGPHLLLDVPGHVAVHVGEEVAQRRLGHLRRRLERLNQLRVRSEQERDRA